MMSIGKAIRKLPNPHPVMASKLAELCALGRDLACPDQSRKIQSGLDKIAKPIAVLARIDAAIAGCSLTDVINLLRIFSAISMYILIRGKIGDLEDARNTCAGLALLGSVWNEVEAGINGTWTRRGDTNVFDGT